MRKRLVWGSIAGTGFTLLIVLAVMLLHGQPVTQSPRGTGSSRSFSTTVPTTSATSAQPGKTLVIQSKPTPQPTALPPITPSNTVTSNFQVSAATYLGGAGSTTTGGIDVAPDRTLFFAGNLPGYQFAGASTFTLLGGGTGTIVHLDSQGHTVLSVAHIGSSINDLHININGSIVACGSFGVALLDTAASKVLWNNNPGNGARCAIGDDGTVALLVGTSSGDLIGGGSAYIYNAAGALLGHWSIGGSWQNDIALDSTDHLVIAAGFTQYGHPIQIAFMRAWSYAGVQAWDDYDFNQGQTDGQGLEADTRAYRVNMGRDGELYMAGESAGGNSIYSRDPKNIATQLGAPQLMAVDAYTTPYNTGSNHITWYGRYNPATGALLSGQFLLARLPSTKGNTIRPRAIMADQNGRVYLGGISCAYIQNRNGQQIAGAAVGTYSGCESFLLIVTPDLRQRLVWTVFTGPGSGHSSVVAAIGVRNGIAAVSIGLSGGTLLTTNALQSQPSGAYMATWTQAAE